MSMTTKPYGVWECTVSTFRDFKVGEKYFCKKDLTGEPRIYPYLGSRWAPYWSYSTNSFCYPKNQLNFKYLGEHEVLENKEKTLEIACEYQPKTVKVNGVVYITGEPK